MRFNWVIDAMAARCAGSCGIRPLTLLVTVATLAATVVSLHHRSQRIFSRYRIPASFWAFRRPRRQFRFRRCRDRKQKLADVILKDPRVESLSSFIGVDGTNMTLNSGRMQINLKPLEQRGDVSAEIIRGAAQIVLLSMGLRSSCIRSRI